MNNNVNYVEIRCGIGQKLKFFEHKYELLQSNQTGHQYLLLCPSLVYIDIQNVAKHVPYVMDGSRFVMLVACL